MAVQDAGGDRVLRLVVRDDRLDGQQLDRDLAARLLLDRLGPLLLQLEVRVARGVGGLELEGVFLRLRPGGEAERERECEGRSKEGLHQCFSSFRIARRTDGPVDDGAWRRSCRSGEGVGQGVGS